MSFSEFYASHCLFKGLIMISGDSFASGSWTSLERARQLLAAGNDPNARFSDGETAVFPRRLRRRCGEEASCLLRLLAAGDARLNVFCHCGQTPIDRAKEEGDEELVAAMRELGADSGWRLLRVSHFDAPLAVLVQQLDEYLYTLYPPDQSHGLKLERLNELLQQESLVFAAIRLDNRPIAMGGMQIMPSDEDTEGPWAELKRFYCLPEMRGQGMAYSILMHLIYVAKHDKALTCLRLETGQSQLDALSLYRRVGFYDRSIYGHYKSLDPFKVEKSVFLQYDLL